MALLLFFFVLIMIPFHVYQRTNLSLFLFVVSICSFHIFMSIQDNASNLRIVFDIILSLNISYGIGLAIQYKEKGFLIKVDWDNLPDNIRFRLNASIIFVWVVAIIYGLIFGF